MNIGYVYEHKTENKKLLVLGYYKAKVLKRLRLAFENRDFSIGLYKDMYNTISNSFDEVLLGPDKDNVYSIIDDRVYVCYETKKGKDFFNESLDYRYKFRCDVNVFTSNYRFSHQVDDNELNKWLLKNKLEGVSISDFGTKEEIINEFIESYDLDFLKDEYVSDFVNSTFKVGSILPYKDSIIILNNVTTLDVCVVVPKIKIDTPIIMVCYKLKRFDVKDIVNLLCYVEELKNEKLVLLGCQDYFEKVEPYENQSFNLICRDCNTNFKVDEDEE